MKKFLSISFALLIFLSGMHLSIAAHSCGGEVAAVKWSFSEQKASCGMEDDSSSCPVHNGISSSCCHDEVAVYAVDNSYSPTSFHLDLGKQPLQVVALPASISTHTLAFYTSQNKESKPPDELSTSMVSLTDICVFRI
ncbi:hypothetical protein [uncultured Acetobacteroides sp.]|uniref:HYC_CC_PP family protein n=1 Tax=uncultured Acetobacteroides sp. TaxID=1760811 RepID=UPI0029F5226E|nr:hypothetical protein [uncultured Acetobacteroides sp.]